MRIYPLNRYVPGTYKRECDRCGWDYLRSELRRDRDGWLVCDKCYDKEASYDQRPRPNITERPFTKE